MTGLQKRAARPSPAFASAPTQPHPAA
jgi:hypothetical protein